MTKAKHLGYWFAGDNIEVVEIDGRAIALNGWNGEKFTDCWECLPEEGTSYRAILDVRTLEVRPVYEEDEDGNFEIVGYEFA